MRRKKDYLMAYVLFMLVMTLSLIMSSPACAEENNRMDTKVGVYVVEVNDINTLNDTFLATFWMWTISPSKDIDPFKNMEFPNAVRVEVVNSVKEERPFGTLIQNKYSGIFRHDWDMSHYPFDKQKLAIFIEEANEDINYSVYSIDTENSGIGGMDIPGWRVTSFEIAPSEKVYNTTFGDPDLPSGANSAYSQLKISMTLERIDKKGFLKMLAPIIIAATMAFVAGFINIEARMGVLVGGIFTTVISMKSTSGELGDVNKLTLVDVIHLYVLAYLLITMISTLRCWWHIRKETDKDRRAVLAQKYEKSSLPITIIGAIVLIIAVVVTIVSSLDGNGGFW